MSMSHLFLMCEGFAPTVIDSQVVDTLAALEREGVVFDLTAVVSPRELTANWRAYRQRLEAYRKRLGGRVSLWPAVRVRHPLSQAAEALGLAFLVPSRRKGPLLIHSRGSLATLIAGSVRRFHPDVRVVFDVRGDAVAELEVIYAHEGAAAIAARRERLLASISQAVSLSDSVLCVSDKLRQLLIERHGAIAERTHVIPCLADRTKFFFDPALRERHRAEHDLVGKRVIVFPGSLGRWHHFDATLSLVQALLESDPRAYFLCLTPKPGAVEDKLAHALPAGRYRALCAPHREMNAWLNASDVGVLLRERHPINAVAAPTKFAEYMLTGLPSLISAEIGDYSEFVSEHEVGAIVDESDRDGAVASFAQLAEGADDESRGQRAELGRDRFSKDVGIPVLLQVYRSLSSQG